MSDIILQHPDPSGDFAPVSERWEKAGGQRVRVRDDDGDHDAYRLPDGSIVAKCLRVPSAAKAAANAAAQAAESSESSRRALIAQRLQERADSHAAQKNATVTTFPQVQAHIRQMHATLEALCRLQRGDVLNDIT